MFSANKEQPHRNKPLDIGDGGGTQPLEKACSFRDKLMGNKQPQPRRERMDLIVAGLVTVNLVRGNRLLPSITISDDIFKELCHPWQEALIVKLLGKSVGYRTMQHRLSLLWKLARGFELMDVDHGYYMVKFDLEADREKVIGGGPWMIFDHYLAVSKWSPDFVSTTAKVEKTLVWVRFPCMNLVFYDESLLLAMASTIGKPIKVDEHTLKVERGRFARVCVEIDLNQPVVGKICVKGTWYKVEYEGLHVLCGKCGCYGHVTRNCSNILEAEKQVTSVSIDTQAAGGMAVQGMQNMAVPSDSQGPTVHAKSKETIIANDKTVIESTTVSAEIKEQLHGDWMTVSRKKKPPQGPPKLKEKNKAQASQGFSNRFDMLPHENHKGGPPLTSFVAGPSGTKDVGQTPLNPKKWAKKRPRHDDQTAKKDPLSKPIVKETTHVAMNLTQGVRTVNTPAPKLVIKDLGDGVKTTMNVTRVSRNHFIMHDDVEGHPKTHENVSGGQPCNTLSQKGYYI